MNMTPTFDLNEHSHTRLNILTGERVLVSPHRSKRPWQGKVEDLPKDERPVYDPKCYLCPGNERVGGIPNPDYKQTFVFTNDFAALQADTPIGEFNKNNLLQAKSESGICKVICFSPRHDLTLPLMDIPTIRQVVDVWVEQYLELGGRPDISYVQIFENKGEMMGASNPHPHGQIWAQSMVPVEVHKETLRQKSYYEATGKSLLADYLEIELEEKIRIVVENEHFVAVVPFWAVWPFETLVVSRRHFGNISEATETERNALAEILKRLTTRYDNLFAISFPYSAGMHQTPTDNGLYPEWHWHMHFYPPLLRSATVKKFMVGYEMLGNPQRDITPESAAERLRALSEIHYKEAK